MGNCSVAQTRGRCGAEDGRVYSRAAHEAAAVSRSYCVVSIRSIVVLREALLYTGPAVDTVC
jgi:hypothetical protein